EGGAGRNCAGGSCPRRQGQVVPRLLRDGRAHGACQCRRLVRFRRHRSIGNGHYRRNDARNGSLATFGREGRRNRRSRALADGKYESGETKSRTRKAATKGEETG